MHEVLRISLMLDFYGQLLTRRQHDIMDMRYNGDYSLGEIAEHLDITRQGVHDNIKKAMNVLNELENKLGLVKKHMKLREETQKILDMLSGVLERTEDGQIRTELQEISERLGVMTGSIQEANDGGF